MFHSRFRFLVSWREILGNRHFKWLTNLILILLILIEHLFWRQQTSNLCILFCNDLVDWDRLGHLNRVISCLVVIALSLLNHQDIVLAHVLRPGARLGTASLFLLIMDGHALFARVKRSSVQGGDEGFLPVLIFLLDDYDFFRWRPPKVAQAGRLLEPSGAAILLTDDFAYLLIVVMIVLLELQMLLESSRNLVLARQGWLLWLEHSLKVHVIYLRLFLLQIEDKLLVLLLSSSDLQVLFLD